MLPFLFFFFILYCTLSNNLICSESTTIVYNSSQNQHQRSALSLTSPRQRVKKQASGICIPLSVINGQVNYLQTNPSILYSSGTTAILSCNIGFLILGSSNSICSSSIWSPPLGTCTPANGLGATLGEINSIGNTGLNCLPQLTPINGQLTYSQGGAFGPYPIGTSVTLKCNTGSTLNGNGFSTCEFGSWQPFSLGQCATFGLGLSAGNTLPGLGITTGGNCIAIPNPINGRISYSLISQSSGSYMPGTVATLICNPGTMSNQITSMCGANGLWNPIIGICSSFGQNPATNIAFFPAGLGDFQCLIGILPPIGSTVSYSLGGSMGPYPDGSIATLFCQNGRSVGPTTSICEGNQWNPPFFQGCIFSDAPSLMGSNNSAIFPMAVTLSPLMFSSPQALGALTFTSADASSTNGLNMLGKGLPFGIPAVGGGSLHCVFGMIPVISGSINYSQGGLLGPYPSGTTATLQCHSGSISLGVTSAKCVNGLWSPTYLGTCGNPLNTMSTATALQELATNNPTMDGLLTATNLGITLTPPNFMQMLSSQSPNTLPLQQCILGVITPLNGKILYNTPSAGAMQTPTPGILGPYNAGSKAQLTCNPGFQTTGVTSATCENGLFQPPLGTCVANSGAFTMPSSVSFTPAQNPSTELNLSNQLGDNETDTLQNLTLTTTSGCPDIKLEVTSKGKIVYSDTKTESTTPVAVPHLVGTKANLICNPGFVSKGNIATVCQTNGWTSPVLGDCVSTPTVNDEAGQDNEESIKELNNN